MMHDFVAASGDYTEAAQTWTLADDESSAQHSFVAGLCVYLCVYTHTHAHKRTPSHFCLVGI